MSEQDGRTHYTGCWYAHHDCARDHIEALNAEIGRLQAELKMANDKIVRHCEAFVRVADERDALRAITDELENANLDGAEDYVRLVSDLRRRIQEMRS